MLYAIIGCVVLLIVAVVLKKQQDKSKDTKADTKKTTAKKTASKKTSITQAESTLQSTAPATEVPVSDDLRRQIENLIRNQDYSTAEALINKNLNQNAAQHGLYLFLLDVHLAQKDEFATSQLLNHVQSLGLDQIAQQVKEKQQIAKAEAAAKRETLEFNTAVTEHVKPAATTANFDALVNTAPNKTSSFDDLQSTFAPSTPAKAEPEVVEQAPLDFSFTSSTPVATETPKAEDVQSLDFSLDHTTTESKQEAPSLDFALDSLDTAKTELDVQTSAPLDFNVDTVPQTASTENTALDFSFESKTDTTPAPLEFALDLAPTPAPVVEPTAAPAVENVTEFKFDLDAPQFDSKTDVDTVPSFKFDTVKETEKPVEVEPSFSFETAEKVETSVETAPIFNFDTVEKTEKPVELNPSFSFDLAEPSAVKPNIAAHETEQPVVSLPISDVADFVETPAQNVTLDPVVQAFPDLLSINEAELNLDLAQHYIQLGAHESARQLLSENEHLFSTEQRQVSEKLLNQMAS